jgi:hypothetical protein
MAASWYGKIGGAYRFLEDSVNEMKGARMSEQHEVDDRHDSLVVEGDDVDHVLPPSELDPFTPEPAPTRGRGAMIAALVVVVVLLAVVVIYAVAR